MIFGNETESSAAGSAFIGLLLPLAKTWAPQKMDAVGLNF